MNQIFIAFVVVLGVFCLNNINAQSVYKMKNHLDIVRINKDFPVSALDDASWKRAKEVAIKTYWSGDAAPAGREFKARLLWSDAAFYVRFEANQTEPLIISLIPDITKKTKSLWNRDVCEIFIAPEKNERSKYFEFEIAPTGEWIDLRIHVLPDKRVTDWDYTSGMKSAAKIEKDKVVLAMKIEWKALGKTPKVGDIWLGNLFRCVGKDPTRGYLAWQPTKTKEPAFHIPKAFGEFQFVK